MPALHVDCWLFWSHRDLEVKAKVHLNYWLSIKLIQTDFVKQILRDGQHKAGRNRRFQTESRNAGGRGCDRKLQTTEPHHVRLGDSRTIAIRADLRSGQHTVGVFDKQVSFSVQH